jgi:hypothetical protein
MIANCRAKKDIRDNRSDVTDVGRGLGRGHMDYVHPYETAFLASCRACQTV